MTLSTKYPLFTTNNNTKNYNSNLTIHILPFILRCIYFIGSYSVEIAIDFFNIAVQ